MWLHSRSRAVCDAGLDFVTQGDADTITKRAAAAHIVRCCPTARESIYAGVGHMPFLEQPERFNRELCKLAMLAHSR